MPILEEKIMVCESLNRAIYDGLNGSSGSSGTPNNDDISMQDKLLASAKRLLVTPMEYEEGPGHAMPYDALKAKYIVLKPPSQASSNHNGAGDRNGVNGNGTDTKGNGLAAQGKAGPSLPQPKKILFPRNEVKVGWKSSGRKWNVGSGFYNMGNTCYMNSILQALFHIPSVASWLLSDHEHRAQCTESGSTCVTCAMANVLLASQKESRDAIHPTAVHNKLRIICKNIILGRQEDAHEFLRYLMEAMERSYLMRQKSWKDLDQYSKETTPLNQILGGYLRTTVRCLSCNYVSVTFQHFEDLLLDIRKADSLDMALEQYFERERLEDMGYKCESCKKRVSATKQFSLERAPIALCIQLKRFNGNGSKITKHIAARPRLDLKKFANQNFTGKLEYRLTSIVTHLGSSQHCGHYTAIGSTESGQFYQFDDSLVRSISMQTVLDNQAYLLFYELDDAPQQQQGTTLPKPPFIGPQLPQRQTLELKKSSDTRLTTTTTSPTPKITNGSTTPTNNASKFANNNNAINGSGSSKIVNGNKLNGNSAPKQNGFHQAANSQSPALASQLPSMPKLDLQTPITPKINGHNGFCGPSTPNKKAQPDQTNVTPKKSDNNGFNSNSTTPSSNGINTPKHTKSLVPYDCDESDTETSDSRQTNDDVFKTNGGLWTVETQPSSHLISPSVKGSTPSCTAKSENNSPLHDTPSTTSPRNGTTTSSSSASSSVVSHLKKMSHQGYGAPVATWNGDKTTIEKEIAQEKREDRKRQNEEDRDLDMDRGRVKKVKHHRDDSHNRSSNGYNHFQARQNQENAHTQRAKWLANQSDRRTDRRDDSTYEPYNRYRQNGHCSNSSGSCGGSGGYYNNKSSHKYHNKHKRPFNNYYSKNGYNQRNNNYHRR